jgi:hypothetical protein
MLKADFGKSQKITNSNFNNTSLIKAEMLKKLIKNKKDTKTSVNVAIKLDDYEIKEVDER